MRAFVDFFGAAADFDFDIVFFRHLAAEALAVLLGRTEHLKLLDLAHLHESLHVRARHAAGAEYANDFRVFVRKIFHTDAAVGADPHVLQVTVVDEGQRLPALDRGQKNQAAVKSWPHAVLLLRDHAFVFGFVDDVGLHANREIAGGRSSLHGAPLIVARRIAGRNSDIDAWPANRFAGGEQEIGLLQRRYCIFHGEKPFDFLVVDDESHKLRTSSSSSITFQPDWLLILALRGNRRRPAAPAQRRGSNNSWYRHPAGRRRRAPLLPCPTTDGARRR